MKVKKIEIIEEKKFKPFAINIDIETKEDLIELWLRFNSSFTPFKEDLAFFENEKNKEHFEDFFETENNNASQKIWELLNKKVEEFELKKKDGDDDDFDDDDDDFDDDDFDKIIPKKRGQ